jgi:hypothetical protein
MEPKTFDAMIQDLVQQAAADTEANWKGWTDALAERERLVLGAQMAFALLDALVSSVARKLVEQQLPVHVARYPPQMRIEDPVRRAVVMVTLQDDRIQIDFFGRDAVRRQEWRASDATTRDINLGATLQMMQGVAVQIAHHVTGT